MMNPALPKNVNLDNTINGRGGILKIGKSRKVIYRYSIKKKGRAG